MTSVSHPSPDHWVVHLGSVSDSEVAVDVRMSRATANYLARSEFSRLTSLNIERNDLSAIDTGAAVLEILRSVATTCRVKERVAAFDQQEVMEVIDEEVKAVRASRP